MIRSLLIIIKLLKGHNCLIDQEVLVEVFRFLVVSHYDLRTSTEQNVRYIQMRVKNGCEQLMTQILILFIYSTLHKRAVLGCETLSLPVLFKMRLFFFLLALPSVYCLIGLTTRLPPLYSLLPTGATVFKSSSRPRNGLERNSSSSNQEYVWEYCRDWRLHSRSIPARIQWNSKPSPPVVHEWLNYGRKDISGE